jgi:hypothetical protein
MLIVGRECEGFVRRPRFNDNARERNASAKGGLLTYGLEEEGKELGLELHGRENRRTCPEGGGCAFP